MFTLYFPALKKNAALTVSIDYCCAACDICCLTRLESGTGWKSLEIHTTPSSWPEVIICASPIQLVPHPSTFPLLQNSDVKLLMDGQALVLCYQPELHFKTELDTQGNIKLFFFYRYNIKDFEKRTKREHRKRNIWVVCGLNQIWGAGGFIVVVVQMLNKSMEVWSGPWLRGLIESHSITDPGFWHCFFFLRPH